MRRFALFSTSFLAVLVSMVLELPSASAQGRFPVTNERAPLPRMRPDATLSVSSPGAVPGDFYLTVDAKGLVGVSDPQWMRTIPELEAGLQNLGAGLAPKIGAGRLLTLIISPKGVITSSDQAIVANGQSAAALLLQYGNLQSAMREIKITIPPKGTIYIDPPIVFDPFPQLARKVEMAQTTVRTRTEALQSMPTARVALPPPLTLTRLGNGRMVSSDPTRLESGCFDLWSNKFGGSPAQQTKYDEFKECVGEYWYLPVVAQVACAIGAGVSTLL